MKKTHVRQQTTASLKLMPGTPMLLELQGLNLRLKTDFLGMDKNRWIMIRTPAQLNAKLGLTQNDPITVRFLLGENLLCGFTTTLISSINRPGKITFLDFPDKYVEMNLRKAERLDCFLPATLICDSEEWNGLILNISNGGCKFVVNDDQPVEALAAGKEAFALYRLPGSDEELFARGTIRNVGDFKGRTALGLSFEGLTDDVRIQVENFVSDLVDFMD